MGYIIIDVGTTNTRIRYIENSKILGEYRNQVGVRNTAIDGSVDKLKDSLKRGIIDTLVKSNRESKDVQKVVAFGMITSNLGLVEIPHLQTPVSLEDLTAGVVKKLFDDIFEKPLYFIPGVKNRVEEVTVDNFDELDIMRGEEVEAFGALEFSKSSQNAIYISPGSHTKFVYIDDEGKIEKCSTTLTGEILWALSKETILASAIPDRLIISIDETFIKKGIDMVKKYGFSKTCFLMRIMELFTNATDNQRANFIAGAICYYDIVSIEEELDKRNPHIIIGGKEILRELYNCIFKIIGYDVKQITLLKNDEVEKISTLGAITVVEKL